MAKRPTKKPAKLTKSQQEAIGLTIASRVNQGMQAYVVAGAEGLKTRYGFTDEQAAAWATETVQLGTKYLRLENGEAAQ